MAATLRATQVIVTNGQHQLRNASDEDVLAQLQELSDGLQTAASELRRLTAELQEERRAGPGS